MAYEEPKSGTPDKGNDSASDTTSAKARYAKHSTAREPYLQRARDCAEVTIPALMPPEGHDGSSPLKTPWQSIGARGLNNLAAKLLLALFPSEVPFFKITPTQDIKEQLAAAGVPEGEVATALSKVETTTLEDIESSGDRAPLYEVLRQLINSGNVLLHMPTDGDVRAFRLDKYVVKRDLSGNWIECILEEAISWEALPDDVRNAIADDKDAKDSAKGGKDLTIYTRVYRDGSRMRAYQEICGQRVQGSEGVWPVDLCPWLPLRMIAVPGEDYGRAYVEEYLGDLDSCELLQKALVEGTVAAARFFIMVNPNGVTKKESVEQAENGAVINGNEEDITTYRAEKQGDLQTGRALSQEIEGRLMFAFLMNTAVQRQAERVTAEEIRYMAEELDSTLGGVYTVLSQELQLPYVRLRIARLQRQKKLPNWPRKSLRLSISTGLDAIGRGRDVQRLRGFAQGLEEVFGPEVVAKMLNVSEYASRLAAGLGVDPKGLVIPAQQVEQEQADQQNAATMASVAPQAVQAGGRIIEAGMKQQQDNPANAGDQGP